MNLKIDTRFVHLGAIANRVLIEKLRYPAGFCLGILAPIIIYLPFSFLARFIFSSQISPGSPNELMLRSYIFIGILVLSFFGNIMNDIGFYLLNERMHGTLLINYSILRSVNTLLRGVSIAVIGLQLLNSILLLLAGYFLLGIVFKADLLILLTVSAISVFCIGEMAVLYAYIILFANERGTIHRIFTGTIVPLLCGISFSAALLPSPLSIVSFLIPITHIATALRYALTGIGELSSVLKVNLPCLVCFVLLLFFVNQRFHDIVVTRFRTHGKWEHY